MSINRLTQKSLRLGNGLKKGNAIILNSDIDSSDVPLKLVFITDSSEAGKISDGHPYKNISPKRCPFWIPVNLKNQAFPDSKITFNNENGYCFPYFDTCVGGKGRLDSVKIDFGNGYFTHWQKIDNTDFVKIMCIVQIDHELSNYISFKNYRLELRKNQLYQIP